jgi:mannose-1-phosphate guanylyltransferase
MKAILLAAGKGTRLKPYTDRHPKCLIPIHGTPLLGIWIDLLARHGVNEVLINTHHHADQVEDFLAQTRPHTPMGLHSSYEPELLGSAGTLWANRDFFAGQPDFIIAYADNLTNLNWTRMFDMHARFRLKGGILTMGLIKAPDPRACGIVTLDGTGKIIKFVEKPQFPESDLANGGVYLAGCEIFGIMGERPIDEEGVYDLGHDLLPRLAGRMYGLAVAPDYLKDIGTPEAYQEALDQWASLAPI